MIKTKIKYTNDMGRGVFANQAFRKNQIVEVSEVIEWMPEDERLIQDSKLRFYVFSNDLEDQFKGSVLALGNGSLFNHDFKPNVTYKFNQETKQMVFKATRAIKKGEQLFINYGYDPVGKTEEWNRRKEYEKAELKRSADALKEELNRHTFNVPTGMPAPPLEVDRSGPITRILGKDKKPRVSEIIYGVLIGICIVSIILGVVL